MIQVDHGIPIPPQPIKGRPRGAPGKRLYPWAAMEVGDSFIFRGPNVEAWQRIHARKAHDRKTYVSRVITENGERIVRIWRVA